MPKPTFRPIVADGTLADPIEYHPVVVKIGCATESMALHRRNDRDEWTVSDPVSGARVLVILAALKGCPVSSASMTVPEARAAAKVQIPALAAERGLQAFQNRLKEVRLLAQGARMREGAAKREAAIAAVLKVWASDGETAAGQEFDRQCEALNLVRWERVALSDQIRAQRAKAAAVAA
jgi:hypothetical protein